MAEAAVSAPYDPSKEPRSGVQVWANDTLRGKIDSIVAASKEAYGRYFLGKDPLVKTKAEEEASKIQ